MQSHLQTISQILRTRCPSVLSDKLMPVGADVPHLRVLPVILQTKDLPDQCDATLASAVHATGCEMI